MDRSELLALRRQALNEKAQIDKERLDAHRKIVDLLYKDDEQSRIVRAQALGQIEKWERNHLCHPRYVVMWRQWLSMPASFAKAAILREDDLGVSMRQNSPFDQAVVALV